MTSHVQPIDAGIVACFKAHCRALPHDRTISRYDHEAPVELILAINQVEAMLLVDITDIAWNMVIEASLVNCFRKTGRLPVETSSGVNTEPKSLQDLIQRSTNDLITARLLPTAQRPPAFDPINP